MKCECSGVIMNYDQDSCGRYRLCHVLRLFKLNSDKLKIKPGQSRELSSETTNNIAFNTQTDWKTTA